jgi:hypothetical protein
MVPSSGTSDAARRVSIFGVRVDFHNVHGAPLERSAGVMCEAPVGQRIVGLLTLTGDALADVKVCGAFRFEYVARGESPRDVPNLGRCVLRRSDWTGRTRSGGRMTMVAIVMCHVAFGHDCGFAELPPSPSKREVF